MCKENHANKTTKRSGHDFLFKNSQQIIADNIHKTYFSENTRPLSTTNTTSAIVALFKAPTLKRAVVNMHRSVIAVRDPTLKSSRVKTYLSL